MPTRQAIQDGCRAGHYEPGEISKDGLRVKLGSNKGLADFFLLKHGLQLYINQNLMDRHFGDSVRRAIVAKALASHASYRQHMMPYLDDPATPVVDLAWMASMPESEKKTVRLFEQLVYGTEYDS